MVRRLTGYVPNVGGNYGNGDNAGLFNFNVNNTPDNSNANYGGRLAIESIVER